MKKDKFITYEWSIAIYQGASPKHLEPMPNTPLPAIKATQITGFEAEFVADPFMLYRNGSWHLYFEIMNNETDKGEIGYATSTNLIDWEYQGIALKESFHLSYPMVFEWNDELFMVPETRSVGEVRLYKAPSCNGPWEKVAVLLEGDYADATLFHHNGSWWMFALHGKEDLHLFYADDLKGQWTLHPHAPIVENSKRIARPSGRIIQEDGRLYRIAQDGIPHYGSRVRMLEILTLDRENYEEREIEESPILQASREGWNAIGMHHIDAHQLADGSWVACVDGAKPIFGIPPAVIKDLTELMHLKYQLNPDL